MAGRFNIRKVAHLLGLGNDQKKEDMLKVRASLGGHIRTVVNTRSYQLTLGNFLKNAEEIDLARLRRGDKKIAREKLEGRLEILEEIQKYINSSIKNGQNAEAELEEIENARRKHAS